MHLRLKRRPCEAAQVKFLILTSRRTQPSNEYHNFLLQDGQQTQISESASTVQSNAAPCTSSAPAVGHSTPSQADGVTTRVLQSIPLQNRVQPHLRRSCHLEFQPPSNPTIQPLSEEHIHIGERPTITSLELLGWEKISSGDEKPKKDWSFEVGPSFQRLQDVDN